MKKSMEDLVRLGRKGDQDAIAELYEQTYTSVYQSVRAIINDEEEALDIVQNSYIKGFQNLDKLEEPEKYQAWMKTIAANQARDYLRKKRPALFSERVDENGEEIDLRCQDDCLEHMPEEVIDRQETTRLMNDILATLKPEQRLVIVMYYYEEMSILEIAEKLGCSDNTVKSRLKYARDNIKAEVQKLEKKGTKLYSLAPMPFFIWLLRMAKTHDLTFAVDIEDAVLAIGTAATSEVSAATAGSAISGNSAAGATVKVAGKALATKIIAATLAVTTTAGVGAIVVNNSNKAKENEAAHIIYEDFLDRYKAVFEMDHKEFLADYDHFQHEILENIDQFPYETESDGHRTYTVEYISGDFFSEGIPIPQVAFTPNMAYGFLYGYHSGGLKSLKIEYAFHDITGDGVDELFFRYSAIPEGTTEIVEGDLGVYTVKDGILRYGNVYSCGANGELEGKRSMWKISGTITHGGGYGDFSIIISCGSNAFGNQKLWDEDPRDINDEKWEHFFESNEFEE